MTSKDDGDIISFIMKMIKETPMHLGFFRPKPKFKIGDMVQTQKEFIGEYKNGIVTYNLWIGDLKGNYAGYTVFLNNSEHKALLLSIHEDWLELISEPDSKLVHSSNLQFLIDHKDAIRNTMEEQENDGK